ncbi:MAG: isocitrate/isopropylmalate dehydrogenase family protein, partial [Planctomycetes bacterium]|nr:isocitrate/isopropylmalate dehydrogenase family protein [Planctomycetota bacterium]
MPKYRIAWLPGDGIGREVLKAARIVLDRIGLDAEYIPGDIGWEFWRREGDALPPRTIELLGNTDCALFGAITSKPKTAAAEEIDASLAGKGLTYRSPIVQMRQLLDLYVCLRPCKAYPGNSLNYREGIDLVVFRENTEDLYAGIEFADVPDLMRCLPGMEKVPPDAAISLKINTRRGCERI